MSQAIIPVALMAATTMYSAKQQSNVGKAQAQNTLTQGENIKAVADYNAASTKNIGEYNARLAERDAKIFDVAEIDAMQRGADTAADVRTEAKASNAKGRAIMGGSGVQVDTGTNLRLLSDNAAIGEMNALTVMNNAEREAYGYRVEAASAREKAQGTRYISQVEADNIALQGDLGLITARNNSSLERYAGKVNATSTMIDGAANIGKLYGADLFSGLKSSSAGRKVSTYGYNYNPNKVRFN